MRGVLSWLLLPLHLAMNVQTVLAFILRGQGRVKLRAKWDALNGLPGLWRKRRPLQSSRVAGKVAECIEQDPVHNNNSR